MRRFSGVFAWVELYYPCQVAGLCKRLWIALRGFGSLKAFSTSLKDENGSTLISSPRTESLHPPLFNAPSQKSSQSLLSPWFLIEHFTQPVTEHFYPRQGTSFSISKLNRLLRCSPAPLLPGEAAGRQLGGGGLAAVLLLPGTLLRERLADHAVV